MVDVWCEAQVQKIWKKLVYHAIREEDWKDNRGGVEYWFAMGVHEANNYTDEVERDM
jgi:TatD DNase family protein